LILLCYGTRGYDTLSNMLHYVTRSILVCCEVDESETSTSGSGIRLLSILIH